MHIVHCTVKWANIDADMMFWNSVYFFVPPCTFASISYVLYCYRSMWCVSSVCSDTLHVWCQNRWVISIISCSVSAASLAIFVCNLRALFTYFHSTQLNSAYMPLLSCPQLSEVLYFATIVVQRRVTFTACVVATSCCISDVPFQWEKGNFDPPQLPHFSSDLSETQN